MSTIDRIRSSNLIKRRWPSATNYTIKLPPFKEYKVGAEPTFNFVICVETRSQNSFESVKYIITLI